MSWYRCYNNVSELLRVEELVQLGAWWVVDLDESCPFRWLFRPQEVQWLLDSGHLLFSASVTAVVGDHWDDSFIKAQGKKEKNNPSIKYYLLMSLCLSIIFYVSNECFYIYIIIITPSWGNLAIRIRRSFVNRTQCIIKLLILREPTENNNLARNFCMITRLWNNITLLYCILLFTRGDSNC